ncbi:S8 family serine peptidase [Actinokineospora sp. PR83]|uniref:S8 family serine peptidase n=1 Tax=Actinokineospora sp. PR83 TaxID=2884908 RepID=UPI001F41C60C|nr:S8 family serine peptidase [Actinokineospora sp. PR83]MCG8916792.1 S8 family serine peptidase [Actinokineospora sp. PR83]
MIQPEWRRRRRIALGMAFSTALAGVMLATGPNASAAPTTPAPSDEGQGIGKHDQELLNKARQAGEKTVKVLISTTEGGSAAKVDELTRAGAKVEYRKDDIGYVRAEVPVDQVKKIAKLPGVSALDLDENVPLPDPQPAGAVDPTPQPAPGPATPRVNPYMPTGDTNAAQFVNDHPTWDGRGTTVAIIDSGVDLAHPSLNTTSTGQRKITDWVTYTDPTFTGGVNNDDDPTWLLMTTKTTGAAQGLPGETGELRIGTFDERDARLGGEVGSDVNRDGNPAGSKGTFGVLWNPATSTVWVDTNQNGTFADDKPMTDYKVKYDIGQFGTDNPATAVKESMPFVVQTDPANQAVNIGIVSGAHGSHVAGIVAGNRLFGGTVNGAAPGANLVSVRVCLFVDGCTNHALLEGMIYAASVANVDVINMSIGGLPALNDANNARAELYDRLINTYDVNMFISAGNSGAGSNTVGDPSVATDVVSVGSYITKETWRSNYGSDLGVSESLHGFSSRGPREDGGFKPNVVAPGSAISTVPTWQPGQPVAGTYELPPGYAQFNGTSMASPQAAGAATLLVSAAKAKGVPSGAAQIRAAFYSTARFINGLGAYEQGNGLIDVKKAWNLLKNNPSTVDITTSVPVNTALSAFLKTPGVGVGINDREGVKPGDTYTRTYTLTRTSGPASPVTYKVDWVGNDGTFSSEKKVTLPLNSAVKFPVTVKAGTAGIHSAIMNLDSPTTGAIDGQTLNTVVAAHDFTAANGYTVRNGGQIGRNQSKSYFFRVPTGTPAFKVDLQGGGTTPGAGQIRFLRFHPYGVGIESNSTPNCYNPSVSGCDAGDPTSRTVSNPQAGVWEIVVEARRTSDAATAPFTLTASVLGATVSPNPDTIASATKGAPVARSYTLKNLFGPFTGKASGTNLGSAKKGVLSIADGASQQYQIAVSPGSTSLRVKIGNTSDAGADLDLALYRCAPSCALVGQSADGDSEEEVTIANPAAGTYVALVDGYAVPAGTTDYDYLDVFTNPAFGSVAVTDANANRVAGASWTVPGTVTANLAPAAGRVLLGNVEVRTDAGVLVGSGDVVVQAVS